MTPQKADIIYFIAICRWHYLYMQLFLLLFVDFFFVDESDQTFK